MKHFFHSLGENPNISVTISVAELKMLFNEWQDEWQEKFNRLQTENFKAGELLTVKEVCKKLEVDVSTLWRWDKTGYLKKIKVGNKVRYRESDINKLMEG